MVTLIAFTIGVSDEPTVGVRVNVIVRVSVCVVNAGATAGLNVISTAFPFSTAVNPSTGVVAPVINKVSANVGAV